jgi:dephospho-CoA kinase
VKYIIGLTGNIATGKSAVSRMLDCLGAEVIDADVLVHELMERGTPIWQAVVQ